MGVRERVGESGERRVLAGQRQQPWMSISSLRPPPPRPHNQILSIEEEGERKRTIRPPEASLTPASILSTLSKEPQGPHQRRSGETVAGIFSGTSGRPRCHHYSQLCTTGKRRGHSLLSISPLPIYAHMWSSSLASSRVVKDETTSPAKARLRSCPHLYSTICGFSNGRPRQRKPDRKFGKQILDSEQVWKAERERQLLLQSRTGTAEESIAEAARAVLLHNR